VRNAPDLVAASLQHVEIRVVIRSFLSLSCHPVRSDHFSDFFFLLQTILSAATCGQFDSFYRNPLLYSARSHGCMSVVLSAEGSVRGCNDPPHVWKIKKPGQTKDINDKDHSDNGLILVPF